MVDRRPVFVVVNLATGQRTNECYANIKNVIRFGLAKDFYDAGQYDIYNTDHCARPIGEPVRAYKRA
jgi:hypothetical protein